MKIRKEITLPSGGTVFIRPPSMLDMVELGEMPPTDTSGARTASKSDWSIKATTLLLRTCTGLIRWPDHKARIVDKPFDECTAEEMTIEDLSDEDASAILTAIHSLQTQLAPTATVEAKGT